MNEFRPEINELLTFVEKTYGRPIRTSTDFDELSFAIKKKLKTDEVSTSTLKRVWQYVGGLSKPRSHTLDVLAMYIGYRTFPDFCNWLKTSDKYNSSFFNTDQLLASDLMPGAQVEIGWKPNRYLLLRYLGDSFFEVEKSRNSKILAGDRFETSCFLIGQPLSLPFIERDGLRTSSFIAGRNGGLTLIESHNRHD